jgi:hypothetical protein
MRVARLSALRTGRLYKFLYWFLLEAESTSRARVRPEGLRQWRIPMTPSGIEPTTFRLVAHCLNKLRLQTVCALLCNYNIDDVISYIYLLHIYIYRQKLYFPFYFYVNCFVVGVATRLLAGRSGLRIPLGPRVVSLSQNVQTGSEAHPAPLSNESKAAGTWCWPVTFIKHRG